ncbi:MAG TPA: FAD-dependent oxidoreductase, partial [Actinomycetota bacterium]|nr:FAD-dependent oxidoreductase [Actinomycetota bacterium]
TGHLLLTERPDDRDELVDIAERQSDAGIETTVVEGTELKALEPGLAPEVLAAAWCPGDGVAAHTATTQIVAAAATEAGVEFRLKNPVSSLDAIDAVDGILIAANQGTAELLRLIDRALPLFPVWPQVVMAEAEGRSPQTLIGHVHRRLVVKRMDAHTVMITGGRLGAVQPDGSVGVEPSEIAATLGDASSVFPELVDATVTVAVADRSESVTPDLVPIVDRIEHDPPVWIATGWSGHGFALAPAVARSIASWMSDGERPGPLAPFSVERFD